VSTGLAAADVRERLAGLAWPGVVAAGAGAFLAGYLLTVLVVVLGPSSTAGGVWGVLVLLAFVFYGAHNVSIDAGELGRVNMLEEAARSGTSVPVARQDPVQTVGVVCGMTGGYAVLAAAGTVVFTSDTIFGTPARLVTGQAVAFGVVYPVVFGTIGAALVGIVATLRNSE